MHQQRYHDSKRGLYLPITETSRVGRRYAIHPIERFLTAIMPHS